MPVDWLAWARVLDLEGRARAVDGTFFRPCVDDLPLGLLPLSSASVLSISLVAVFCRKSFQAG